LPLAHEQAAAYCERLDITIDDYRRRFTATPIKVLDDERDAPVQYNDRQTVAKTFALALDIVKEKNAAAASLIIYASLLGSESIPLFIFGEGREELPPLFASQLADDGLDEAVATLRGFSLINRESILDERDQNHIYRHNPPAPTRP
jgi:hypothetical protein